MSYVPNTARTDRGNSWSIAQITAALGSIDMGSTAKPWRDLYLSPNGGSNYQKITSAALTGNRTLTLPDADSTAIIGTTATANQFLTHVTTGGVQTKAQPSFSNLSGTATIAQGGTNNGSLEVSALGIYAGDGSKIIQVTGSASQQFRVNAAGTAIEAFTPSAGSSKWTLSAKSANFTANDSSMTFYIVDTTSGTITVTLPASPADGTIYKFARTAGSNSMTLNANGSETILVSGTDGDPLTITNGVVELIAITGGWIVT